MKKTNWEKSSGMPFKHFPDVVYPSVFDIYVCVYFFCITRKHLWIPPIQQIPSDLLNNS